LIKRLIPHSTRVLNDRVVGYYLLFSRLELKLPMIIFHIGFLSGRNIDAVYFFALKEQRISSSCCMNKKFDEQKGVAVYAVVGKYKKYII
jgi:hypothetical protein